MSELINQEKKINNLIKTSITEFISHYLFIYNDELTYPIFLPLIYNYGTTDVNTKFTKSNMTRKEHKELHINNKVMIKDINNNLIEYKLCLNDKFDLFELHIGLADENICVIDIDEKNKTFEEVWESLPDLFKKLPFTLSRKKNLPHFYCILDGISKKDLLEKKTIQKCFNFAEGDILTNNVWEKKNSIIYNYDNSLPIIHIEELIPYLKKKEIKN